MKLLIADKFPEKYLKELKNKGHDVTSNPDLKAEDLPDVIVEQEILIVRSTKVTEAAFNASNKLAIVIRAGAGTNTIDIKTAAKKGIFVCNTPGKNALAVAELAFGLLLSIDRNIPDNVIEMRNKVWDKKRFSKTTGICGRKVGVVGTGEIGRAFAARAKAFGMKLYAIQKPNRSLYTVKKLEELDFSWVKDINELADTCDVISFHIPSNADTKGIINKEFLSHVKPNSIILNTSRGNIAADEALIEAMNSKNIRCGLDVYNNEPASGKDEINTALSQHPNVYGTHHIGASTEQAQLAIAKAVFDLICDFEKGHVNNCVNLEKTLELRPTLTTLTIRHGNKVGVLSNILDILKKQNINVDQLENREFAGKNAAFSRIYTEAIISNDIIRQIESLLEVYQVTVK